MGRPFVFVKRGNDGLEGVLPKTEKDRRRDRRVDRSSGEPRNAGWRESGTEGGGCARCRSQAHSGGARAFDDAGRSGGVSTRARNRDARGRTARDGGKSSRERDQRRGSQSDQEHASTGEGKNLAARHGSI